MSRSLLRTIHGMHDVVPSDNAPYFTRSSCWETVLGAFRHQARAHGYSLITTPTLEHVGLFVRSVGESSDIVNKEMFSFERGDDHLVLRPEGSAPVARAVAQHNLCPDGAMVKVCYAAPMFRAERPQRGRYRQHTQLGLEAFGSPGPVLDAEVIGFLHGFYRSLGLSDYVFRVNSLGDADARQTYREALQDFFRPKLGGLCKDCHVRFEKNPLRILDCKVPACREAGREAPELPSFLSDEDRAHFSSVLEMLDALGVPYSLDPRLVRGLDYYGRTCFEVDCGSLDGSIKVIGAGGRYDGLVKSLGGRAVPAVGFGCGVERVLLACESQGIDLGDPSAPEVMLIDPCRQPARVLPLASELRAAGLKVAMDYRGAALRRQLKRATQQGARWAVFLPDELAAESTVGVKDLDSGEQRDVSLADLTATLLSLRA